MKRPIDRRTLRGLSLVELMIGLVLGLFVVAGALAIHA
jgi:Tfp pilus assembly protein PilW